MGLSDQNYKWELKNIKNIFINIIFGVTQLLWPDRFLITNFTSMIR